MTGLKTLAAAFAASTLLVGAAVAADQTAQSDQGASSPRTQADSAAAKLSTDGISAFRDVHLARIAIYETKPDQARMFVSHAQSVLDKAGNDAAAFTKAEADLKPPAGMGTASTMAGNDAGATKTGDAGKGGESGRAADASDTSKNEDKGADKTASTAPLKWLPIDAQLVLADDFVPRKDQTKAVDEANQHLKSGDQKGALNRLKLAGIDVDLTMAVLPLDKTTSDVDQAAKLIADGKYYEASMVLKTIEDSVRFDVVDATVVPKGKGSAGAGNASKPKQ